MIHGLYIEVEQVVMKYVQRGINFYYFCSGRGLGKTYSSIDFAYRIGTGQVSIPNTVEDGKVLFLRRTAVEAEAISRAEKSFFKKYNKKEGKKITTDYNSKLSIGNFYADEERETLLGYIAGLTTFSNSRGVDFSDVVVVIYDECIPESENKTKIKNEGYLVLNALETINRNRQQEGLQEIIFIMLSNPIDLGNELLAQLDITSVLNYMILNNMQKYTNPDRSLHIEKYKNHKVSQQKRKSVLYKFASTTGFVEQALSGDFTNDDMSRVKRVNLHEYKPFLSLEQICVYKHKSSGDYHLSTSMAPARYVFYARDRETVRKMFIWSYKLMILDDRVTYESYQVKVVFESMIGYKPLLT